MKKIVIVGGGTAGMTAAAMLLRKANNIEVTLIEPSDYHYYQPLWTLVGGGIFPKERSRKKMVDIMPKKVKWIQKKVAAFNPKENSITLEESNKVIEYDYLIVSPGIQIDWDKVEGLREAMGKDGVCSNYSYESVDSTWESIQNSKSGNALFTYPNTPIKCGGAPQKIMYLAEEYFRKNNLRKDINVEFVTAGGRIFGVQKYRTALEKIVKDRNINTSFNLNLVKVDAKRKVATFENVETKELIEKEYEMLHAVPPMSSPDFIKNSPISNSDGWVDVDKYTTQHNTYKNIFSMGDASSLPTSKSGAAVRKEAPVLVNNLLSYIRGKELTDSYSGYTSCPLVTGYGKVIMAEFDYDGNPMETFPFDQSKERYTMFLLKKYGIPFMYWHGMMKGWT